ncbi:MAG TPA: sigma-70 family RNA polymerase sigma factor [Acidimicrobiales bacterium]|nr:sigma-70 family RNA polymerase sigma factor [Acidimicrobiales bacterium]
MAPDDAFTAAFDARRDHLRAVAYRMLGSLHDADDAVQQAWLRAAQADRRDVRNVAGWLTTITARVCLDMLRRRQRRGERSLAVTSSAVDTFAGDGVASRSGDGGDDRGHGEADPAEEAVLAESVGLALLVVLDRLSPAQRVAFVLHDLFAVPFEDIAVVTDRSVAATKTLASRARTRVQGGTPAPAPDLHHHRAVVDAFLAASRDGDIDALLRLLAPDVVRHADRIGLPAGVATEVRGARAVAEETRVFMARARTAEVALVDGAPGIVVAPRGRLFAVLRVTVEDGRVAAFEVLTDPARLARLELAVA